MTITLRCGLRDCSRLEPVQVELDFTDEVKRKLDAPKEKDEAA